MRVLGVVLRDIRDASPHPYSEQGSWLGTIGFWVLFLSFGFLFERLCYPFRWSLPHWYQALYFTVYSELYIILYYYYYSFVYSLLVYFIHLAFCMHVSSCVRGRINHPWSDLIILRCDIYDPRDNNKSTEDRQEQERQTGNASIRGERGNSFGDKILNFFARRKQIISDILMYQIIIYRIKKYYLSY
jgi:hypothetical protein